MHVYTVGFKTADGVKALEITHDQMMSQDDLESLIRDVLPDAARRHIASLAERERKRGQIPNELFDRCFIPRVTFNHICNFVVDLLIERHGFAKLEYTASVTVFSIPDLLVRGDAAGDPDGDDALQGRLNDVLAEAGLPVVTMEQRDAQEEEKITLLTPVRRRRRAQRAAVRWRATGHNPFKTEDVLLIQAVLEELSGRSLTDEESTLLSDILPAFVEDQQHTVEEIGAFFLKHPALESLAAVLGIVPSVAEIAQDEAAVSGDDRALSADGNAEQIDGDDKADAPLLAMAEERLPESEAVSQVVFDAVADDTVLVTADKQDDAPIHEHDAAVSPV